MKKILFSFVVLLLFSSVAVSSMAGEEISLKEKEFIMNQAALDILGNIDVWVDMERKVDGASATAWRVILGDKLPSQPVGVITVLAALPQESYLITSICPRPFFEGAEIDDIEAFEKKSQLALESFTMVDSEKERIRKICLESIKETMARNKK